MKLSIVLLALTLSRLAMTEVEIGSNTVIEESRQVNSFTAVSIASGLHVTLAKGNAASVKLRGDDNILPLIETEVSGDELKIHLKKDISIRITRPIEVSITIPSLKKISASGGSHIVSSVGSPDAFAVEASDASHVTVQGLNVRNLDLDSMGGSSLDLRGKADKMKFDGSGGSLLKADALQVTETSLEASGGTKLHMQGSSKIIGEISGGSLIYTLKSASVSVLSSGGSRVIKD
ncbi:MAG: DUF2807 domain-containing protein [Pseudobdellovibrionaceae bacterium]|nr:DUF2807 domain-containing protein [Pseudobdellovibrionaceae bacterium]